MSTVNFEQAEKNARLRDIQNSKVLTEDELRLANELQAKANSKGMKLVPERKVKNKAKFAQIIQENWLYLIQNDYLKTEEIVFLNKIIGFIFIGFRSNCIVHDINAKEQIPMTQTEIAEKIRSSKNTVSRLVRQLIDKGIIGRFESGREGINARMYALYINPNVILCGDRDAINQTLQTMVVKKPKGLKNLPIKLV
jgi:hypothetical protein